MADNRGTVAGIYEAFGRGDVAWILDRLDDDVSWDEGVRSTGLPYLRAGRGKEHVAGFFECLMATIELTRFEPGPICDGGDVVMVPVLHAGQVHGGGEVPPTHEAHEWRFGPDGKVVEFHHVFDYAVHERALARRSEALVGRTLRAVGDEIEVLAAGAELEMFRLSGPRDSGPPPHSHPWTEAYYGLSGEVTVTVGNTTTRLSPGQSLSVPADTLHSYRITSDAATFLAVTGGGRAAAFFADLDAHVPPGPPDETSLPILVDVARRNGLSSPLFD